MSFYVFRPQNTYHLLYNIPKTFEIIIRSKNIFIFLQQNIIKTLIRKLKKDKISDYNFS